MTKIFGILNITSDSFSDGGKFNEVDLAISQALKMQSDGADVIDIGAESTRPNARTTSPEDEWKMLEPVLKSLSQELKIPISIDTRNYQTAQKSLKNGASIINDVSGLSDENMLRIVSDAQCQAVFMHSLRVPADKNITLPENCDPIAELKKWAVLKANQFDKSNISKEKLILDPGLGFGKTSKQSLEIVKRIEELHKIGFPLLIGHSEKSFLTEFTGKPAGERLEETIIVSSFLASKKVDYIRVHNVAANKQALRITKELN